MKVARTVLSGGKDGDNFKVLPIATNKKRACKETSSNVIEMSIYYHSFHYNYIRCG